MEAMFEFLYRLRNWFIERFPIAGDPLAPKNTRFYLDGDNHGNVDVGIEHLFGRWHEPKSKYWFPIVKP